MNNFELDKRAKELAASHSGYNLARRLLALEEELQEARRENLQSQQAQGEAVAWEKHGNEWRLMVPGGSGPVATVWENGFWHTWDENGTGLENSSESGLLRAQEAASESAIVQGLIRIPPPAPAAVPDELPMPAYSTIDRGSKNYKAGWNACRKAMLAAPAPAAVPECPFPCGWNKLYSLAVEKGAYLTQRLEPGDEITNDYREAIISQSRYLLETLSVILKAAPSPEDPK